MCHRQRELIEQLAKEVGISAAAKLVHSGQSLLREKVQQMLESGGPLLLVLDDVWSEHQLLEVLGTHTHLPPGSQLLLTSRRRDVAAAYNPVPMQLLPHASALELLAWHARGQFSLPTHQADVARAALRMCGGLPLAVKVLGTMLRRTAATRIDWQVRACWPYRCEKLW